MRILIYGLNFAPELVGVGKYTGEMAEWLAAQGHQVRAVTAPPFNPQWRVAAAFSASRYTREEHEKKTHEKKEHEPLELIMAAAAAGSYAMNRSSAQPAADLRFLPAGLRDGDAASAPGRLTVFRCPLWVRPQLSATKRILHLASFALASFPVMLGQIGWRPEIVMVIEPTLFCLPTALLTARCSGARTWLHVQDFEADAGFELGFLKTAGLRTLGEWAEKKLMSGFDRVSTISEKMMARLFAKGVTPSACRLFPNWVDTDAIFPLRRPSALRAELGISSAETVALYAGSMARKQGLEVLAEAAGRLAGRSGLRFVFCGEGPGRSALEGVTGQMANVQWIALQPFERLNELVNLADIHLLPQCADAADLVMPSKLTGMLASGRPIVATSHSGTQLAEVVGGLGIMGLGIIGQGIDARGIVVEPGDASALVHAIEELTRDRGLREKLGRNGREYAVSELGKETILSRFEKDLLALVEHHA